MNPILGVKRLLKRRLGEHGYHVVRRGSCNALQFLLEEFLERQKSLRFVQIGANDGISSDPIYDFAIQNHERVSGLCLEPVKMYFDRLKANYARYPRITPVHAAIHATERTMTMYRLDPSRSGFPSWANGMASFSKASLLTLEIPEDAIIEESIQCMTLSELLARHQWDS